MNIHSVCLW